MVEENQVNVRITALAEGTEAYDEHVRGMDSVTQASLRARAEMLRTKKEFYAYRMSLGAISSAAMLAANAVSLFGGNNEIARKAVAMLNLAMAGLNTVMLAQMVIASGLAKALITKAIAYIMGFGPLAPVVAASVAASVASMLIIAGKMFSEIKAMAFGGEGVVTRPTLFLAGESGPERYSFEPLSQNISNRSLNIGSLNVQIVSHEPDTVGEALVKHIKNLRSI